MTDTRDDTFEVAGLIDEACRTTGGRGADLVGLEALGRLADALDGEAALTPGGRTAVRDALVGQLTTQIRSGQLRRENPRIAQTPVDRPVFITGMLRTGTTVMHNLLAEHPDLRAPRLWELLAPVGRHEGPDRELISHTQAYVEEYYRAAPALPSAHHLDAQRPDECQRLTGTVFTSMIYELRYHVPGYGEWLHQQDQKNAYAFHRRLLQHILWRIPGQRVVMKCPFHLWQLPALVAVYPDAHIIHMHRDPAVTIPSTCSLTEIVRGARSDRIDRRAIGSLWNSRTSDAIAALPQVRSTALANTPVFDVSYPRLMADPIKMAGDICDFVGVPMTAAAEHAMRAYLNSNPQRKHGSHQYTAEDYGLNTAELTDRFADHTAQYAS